MSNGFNANESLRLIEDTAKAVRREMSVQTEMILGLEQEIRALRSKVQIYEARPRIDELRREVAAAIEEESQARMELSEVEWADARKRIEAGELMIVKVTNPDEDAKVAALRTVKIPKRLPGDGGYNTAILEVVHRLREQGFEVEHE